MADMPMIIIAIIAYDCYQYPIIDIIVLMSYTTLKRGDQL